MSKFSTQSDWLTKLGYPSPGVGDLEDLRLVLGVGSGGRWNAYVKPGWFYCDNIEQYNYIALQEKTSTVTLIGTIDAPYSFRPAWGPVLVAEGDSTRYIEHHNCYLPVVVLSWSLIDNGLAKAFLPVDTILLSVRGFGQDVYGTTSTTGYLTDGRLFFYDNTESSVYIAAGGVPASGINVFADLATIKPNLRFRESVVEEGDGTNGMVRASYLDIKQVVAYRGSTSQVLDDSTDGWCYHSLGVEPGDWVVLEYYINKSFVVSDHDEIQVYTGTDTPVDLVIHSEGTPPEYLQQSVQAYPDSGKPLQFNPLFSDSFRAGFFYHSNSTTIGTPDKLEFAYDKDEVVGAWHETVKAVVTITDKDGIPLPAIPLTISHNQSPSGMLLILPVAVSSTGSVLDTYTDNRGEVHMLVAPTASTSGTLTISVSCLELAGSLSIPILSEQQAIPASRYLSGVVSLIQGPTKTSNGFSRLYCAPHYLDGIPRDSSSLVLESENTSTFEYTNNFAEDVISVQTASVVATGSSANPGRVVGLLAPLGIIVSGADNIVAQADGGQSPIVRALEEV